MICSSPDLVAPLPAFAPSTESAFGSSFSFAGEIGIVSSGTGELGLRLAGAVSRVAMMGSVSWVIEGRM